MDTKKILEQQDRLINYALKNSLIHEKVSDDTIDHVTNLARQKLSFVADGELSIQNLPLTYIIPLLTDNDIEELLKAFMKISKSRSEALEALRILCLRHKSELSKLKTSVASDTYESSLKLINSTMTRLFVFSTKQSIASYKECLASKEGEKIISLFKEVFSNLEVDMRKNQMQKEEA